MIWRKKYFLFLGVLGLIAGFYIFNFYILNFGQVQTGPGTVEFTADAILDLSGLDTTTYIASGSKADSLTISGTNSNVYGIWAGTTFLLKTATHKILQLTPSAGTADLTFSSTYVSSGYVSQWSETSSVEVAHVVGVSKANSLYIVKVGGVAYGTYNSGPSAEISFSRTGSGLSETFTIEGLFIPISGPFTVTESLAFPGTVNGVELGNLTIAEGKTLTINAGQTVVWNSGYSVIINGSIAINKGSPGGQLRKANIYMKDEDDDGYPDNFTMVASSTQPTNYKRRSDFAAVYTACGITYVADMKCGPGRYLDGDNCIKTAAGYYSLVCDNSNSSCPAGTYGSDTGLATAACTGPCAAGYYGTAASVKTTDQCTGPCDPGYYGSTTGLTASTCTGLCAAGRYGTTGQTASTCSGACAAGYYGAAGTVRTTSSCDGLCAAGRYGSTTGLTASSCTDACAAGYYGASGTVRTTSSCDGCCSAGYYCPAGSATQNENACATCKTSNACAGSSEDCYTVPDNYSCGTCQFCQTGSCVYQYYDSRNTPTLIATIQIGTQCWMKQSMNVGTRIAGTSDQGTSCASIQKYCYDDLDSRCDSDVQSGHTYPDGGLYQWNQAMCGSTTGGAQGICPAGWHIPTDAEYTTLITYLGGSSTAGTKMKPAGASGFEGNLTGNRGTDGTFGYRGTLGHYWSSDECSGTAAWYRYLYKENAVVYRSCDAGKYTGFVVRCLKD